MICLFPIKITISLEAPIRLQNALFTYHVPSTTNHRDNHCVLAASIVIATILNKQTKNKSFQFVCWLLSSSGKRMKRNFFEFFFRFYEIFRSFTECIRLQAFFVVRYSATIKYLIFVFKHYRATKMAFDE